MQRVYHAGFFFSIYIKIYIKIIIKIIVGLLLEIIFLRKHNPFILHPNCYKGYIVRMEPFIFKISSYLIPHTSPL